MLLLCILCLQQFCSPLFGLLRLVPGFVEFDWIVSWLEVDVLSHGGIV